MFIVCQMQLDAKQLTISIGVTCQQSVTCKHHVKFKGHLPKFPKKHLNSEKNRDSKPLTHFPYD